MAVPAVVGAPGEVPYADPVGDVGEVAFHPRGRPAQPVQRGGPVLRQVAQPHLGGPVPPLRPGAEEDELVLIAVSGRGGPAPGQDHPDTRDQGAGVLAVLPRGRRQAVRLPERTEYPVGRQGAVDAPRAPGAHR
ncbi:hypothetical protein ABZ354_21695 [Streptomyces sp. NPDC005925]|uniref:hypothetical protein n=1 Tax=Streptomyces sp. NPDC005925 TaxID=3157172 RepID=UPI00340F4749